MQLLVSVANGAEATAALEGGADIVDAKDPRAGALGAVSLDAFREIEAAVGGMRVMTAALGDARDEASIQQAARSFAAHGASLVKIGFGLNATANRMTSLVQAAVLGATTGGMASGVIAVRYADGHDRTGIDKADFVRLAARAGAAGVMLDTADKRGPSLRALMAPDALTEWIRLAHEHGLTAALAGKLSAEDLPFVHACGADVAGVRGAACEGGRFGVVTADRVRQLRQPALFAAVSVSS